MISEWKYNYTDEEKGMALTIQSLKQEIEKLVDKLEEQEQHIKEADFEIERLNNIINELEEEISRHIALCTDITLNDILDKLQELKRKCQSMNINIRNVYEEYTDKKDKEIERLNNIINRIDSFVDRTIMVIQQQPSGNDEWILERLNGIKYLTELKGIDDENKLLEILDKGEPNGK